MVGSCCCLLLQAWPAASCTALLAVLWTTETGRFLVLPTAASLAGSFVYSFACSLVAHRNWQVLGAAHCCKPGRQLRLQLRLQSCGPQRDRETERQREKQQRYLDFRFATSPTMNAAGCIKKEGSENKFLTAAEQNAARCIKKDVFKNENVTAAD